MSLPEATLAAFSFFNVLRLVSYLPQLWRIARDGHGATAISYSTWGIWIGANASTAAYAWVNLADARLAAINGINTLCCIAVCALTAFKRRQWRQRTADAASARAGSSAPSDRRLAQFSPADSRRR
ncbi:MAG: hypothetical protein ACK5PW_11485 [Burkholderiales bacterium]